MPPGPLYNWLCVLHSASEILIHASLIRSAQVASFQKSVIARTRTVENNVKGRDIENDELKQSSQYPSDGAAHRITPLSSTASVLVTRESVPEDKVLQQEIYVSEQSQYIYTLIIFC